MDILLLSQCLYKSIRRYGQNDEFVSQWPGILSRAKAFQKAPETEGACLPRAGSPLCRPSVVLRAGLGRSRGSPVGGRGASGGRMDGHRRLSRRLAGKAAKLYIHGFPLHVPALGESFSSPGSKLPACIQTSDLINIFKYLGGTVLGFCACILVSEMSVFHLGANARYFFSSSAVICLSF